MTPEEIEVIKEAQDYCRRRKAHNEKIYCPMVFPVSMSEGHLDYACRVCYKWMELPYKARSHPCFELSNSELRKRFWRNPDLPKPI